MSRQISIEDSITIYPSGYDSANSDYSGVSSSYPISNGYDGTSSTNYAYITCNTGSRATTYISYTFNVSGVPEEAQIDSIECKVKVRVSSTSYISAGEVQLYSGETEKGSGVSARTTSATTYTISNPGSWTRSELDNIEIRYTGTRGTSQTTRAAYLYFYGCDLTINYSIHGMAYTINASSSVPAVEVSPATQEVMEGEDCTVVINTTDIGDYTVTDNGTDVTNLLEWTKPSSSGEVNAVPGSDFDTEFSSSDADFYMSSSSTGTDYLERAIRRSAEDPYNHTSNTYVKGNNNTATGSIYYTFDFSEIPYGATIESVSVKVYGARENSTIDSTHKAEVAVYSGTTLKGAAEEFTSTSNSILTLDNVGTWTREELQEARVKFTVAYYGGRVGGISFNVAYSADADGYYTYTLVNVTVDHIILLEEAGAYIPPEEDPELTYWPVTISSINATTNPATGTVRVVEGTSETITISPTDPQLTLALDNGVDITSQLIGGTPTNTYTVDTQVSGASYGFNLNSSTGYYVSTNNGVSKSASVARLQLELESDCLVTLQYINYAEAQYDYGLFGKVDTTVATDGLTAGSGGSTPSDSTSHYQYICNSSSDSTSSTRTISYEVPAGSHYIDIKYGKDDASDSGNDSLQWKVLSIEATSAGGDYTYNLTNITEKHSLVFIFGDVTYYFINSSGTGARLFPDGQLVKLPGDSYKINIVPDNITDEVTITDNNVDKTSELVREEGTDKTGATVVSYHYSLTNIQATHTLVVTSAVAIKTYIKINGQWVQYSKVWYKADGRWVEEPDPESILQTNLNYVWRN